MNAGRIVFEFVVTFAIAFVASAIVSAAWAAVAHGSPAVDWETAARFGLIFGIVSPWVISRGAKR
ncbi:MAG: hypothetical protein JW876_06465 [Candidatus Krumholzibacteriota bacterium]|nr:hypothetical protein [Candidatus Krumholzibacteriota bacterium]